MPECFIRFISVIPLVMSHLHLTISVATEEQTALLGWKNPVQFSFSGNPSSGNAKTIFSKLASNEWRNPVELISCVLGIADKHLQTFKQDVRLGPSSKIETHIFTICDNGENEEQILTNAVELEDTDDDAAKQDEGNQMNYSIYSVPIAAVMDPERGTYTLLEKIDGGGTRRWHIENGTLTIDGYGDPPTSAVFTYSERKHSHSPSFRFVNGASFCTISCNATYWYAHIFTTKETDDGSKLVYVAGHSLGLPCTE